MVIQRANFKPRMDPFNLVCPGVDKMGQKSINLTGALEGYE